ncbi:lysophosphatidic acid phosphatase type 6-like [Mya arenaria]|uniref:lysophosphatidic acid phosphatase type 6-like n=1 Tax=Mya arenaria TaxID=6604 RepID=UPI0022E35E25|nr:lysophosphatidic acid phosphatase type 6-like [Mya arenaria]
MFSSNFQRLMLGAGGLLATGTSVQVVNRENGPYTLENGRRRLNLDGYELKMVQVLVRHGARTPIHTIKHVPEVEYDARQFLTDVPHTSCSYVVRGIDGGERPFSKYDGYYKNRYLKGGALRGQLTQCGQDQMYIKGRQLRREYVDEMGLIDAQYSPQQVFVRSTNINRTILTARCVLVGLFGRENLNKLEDPLVIHVEKSECDPLVPRTAVCRTLRQINHAAMIHGGDIPGIKEDRWRVEQCLGITEPDHPKKHKINFIDIRDDLVARETHGLHGVKCLDSMRREIELNASKVMYYSFCGQHEAWRDLAMQLSTGPLVKMLTDNIDNMNENKTKLYIFSCHDSTLVGLLGTLDVYDFTWPPFGSDVRFELYENRRGQKFVRVSYNGKDVTIRGCTHVLCPLEEFKAAMQSYAIDESQFKKICDSNILEVIAKEMLEQEKDEEEDEETSERSDVPAGM